MENQLVVRRMVSEFFDAKAGVRFDTPDGPDRIYGLLGFEGLTPQWIEVDGDLFLSEKGDLSARFSAEHDLLITNRLLLQPVATLDLAATDDRAIGQGQGFTDLEQGMRRRSALSARPSPPQLGLNREHKPP